MRALRAIVATGIAALAACTSFGADGVTASPDPNEAGSDASASPAEGGGADVIFTTDAKVVPGLLPIEAYSYGPPTSGEVIRAVTAEGGRVFFSNLATDSIEELLGDTPNRVFPGPGVGQQLVVKDNFIWRTGAGTTNDELHRYDTGGQHLDTPVASGAVGCAYVDPGGSRIYATNYAGRIFHVPVDGTGAPVNALDQTSGPSLRIWGVAVIEGRIFYTRDETQIVTRSGNADAFAGAETPLLDGLNSPQCLTIDGGFLYFPTYRDGVIHRVKLDGTDHVILAQEQLHPTQIGITGGNLYWNSGNKVMKLPIPAQ